MAKQRRQAALVMNQPKKKAKWLWILGLLLAVPTAQADVRIPNTKVSYNNKGVYIDERYDTVGKTYLALTCARGYPQVAIYSKVPLASNGSLGLVYVNWAQDSSYSGASAGVVRKDKQLGHLGVWEADGADTYSLLSILRRARTSVSATVERDGLSPVTYTFPVKGFDKAFKNFSCS